MANYATPVSQRAMLVTLSVKMWGARKEDKDATREVAANHGIQDSTNGSYRKQLLKKEALKELKALASEIREFTYNLTLPYTDAGIRILSNSKYNEYIHKVDDVKKRFEIALRAFLKDYETYRDEAKSSLGSLWKPEDYPSVESVKTKFRIEVGFAPVPEAQDFRLQHMIDAEVNRITNDFEAVHTQRLEEAMKVPYQRLTEKIAHLRDHTQKFSELAAAEQNLSASPIRDTMVTHLIDLLDLIPGLNITEDENLTNIATEARQELTKWSGKQLRDDEQAREIVVNKADEILAKIADFI